MPFRDADRSHDLNTRIDLEVRARLEEAIDFVCLEALVQRRRARGLPAPEADNPRDRAEYEADVVAFLRLLSRDVPAGLDAAARGSDPAPARGGRDEQSRLLADQVLLARRLPDYWQRFETSSARYLAEPADSGRESGGVLRRLFGRG
jgi:hypothetical protein